MPQANEARAGIASVRPADEGVPELDDAVWAKAKRGGFLPRDPAERAARLEARVQAIQRAGLRLRDENERLRVLLAWEAGVLTEAQAAARLEVDLPTLHDYREAALRLAG